MAVLHHLEMHVWAGCIAGHPDRADLGVGERHPWHGAGDTGSDVLAQDVPHRDIGLSHGDMGVRTATGHVADRPHAIGSLHALAVVDRDLGSRVVQAEGRDSERAQVRSAPGGNEQVVGRDRLRTGHERCV